MVAMKRPAAAFAARKGRGKKARSVGAEVLSQCGLVAAAVLEAETFPSPVLEMLGSNLTDSLGVAKETRHPFQEKVVTMVGEVLQSVEAAKQAAVAEAEAKLGEVTAVKEERETAEKAATDELAAKEEVTSTATTAAQEAALALTTAEEALAAAEAGRAAGMAAQGADEKKKGQLETILASNYMPLKEGSVEGSKTRGMLASVMALGQEFEFDGTLLDTLPTAVAKAPGDRGTFDNLVVEQLEKEFKKCVADLEAKIAAAEPARKEHDAKVAEASAEVEKAKASDQEQKAALEAAKAAQKEALAAMKEAAKTVKQTGPEMKEATAALASAEAGLKAFRESPLAAYKALLERPEFVPEEPAPEEEEEEKAEEPPAEEAPAEEAVAEAAAEEPAA